jgi:hypothetical protein
VAWRHVRVDGSGDITIPFVGEPSPNGTAECLASGSWPVAGEAGAPSIEVVGRGIAESLAGSRYAGGDNHDRSPKGKDQGDRFRDGAGGRPVRSAMGEHGGEGRRSGGGAERFDEADTGGGGSQVVEPDDALDDEQFVAKAQPDAHAKDREDEPDYGCRIRGDRASERGERCGAERVCPNQRWAQVPASFHERTTDGSARRDTDSHGGDLCTGPGRRVAMDELHVQGEIDGPGGHPCSGRELQEAETS